MNIDSGVWIAKCAKNAENAVEEELESLGAENIKQLSRAVSFEGDLALMYKANVHLRCASTILKPLLSFEAETEDDLYVSALAFPWHELIDIDDTFSISHTINSPYFKHSGYTALKLKDAIVDKIRNEKGSRPSVDIERPTYNIDLHIGKSFCHISLNTSGEPLFKRGYRVDGWKAPIKEDLAATMLHYAGWKGETAFMDPMCGSGTFIIEAAMMAGNVPPNLTRDEFAFERWNNYDNTLFENILDEAEEGIKKIKCPFIANDIHAGALKILRENLDQSELKINLETDKLDFKDLERPYPTGLMMINPPYDKRLEKSDEELYKSIGDWMKKGFSGWRAGIILPVQEKNKSIGLRSSLKKELYNGPIQCAFLIYDMYSGSKE